ncbi:MAG TPA: prepilin-type N-terminal cleavage/methylation domain-containing protein [Vicinamibacterales bacterium]|jgi:prepilin-type N-terminal cleavage/methylation domain-containing protein|nr:prepilin-type N-terminal cleavage/methylation domain-containing protein [Vicinamibacterales bacterium]
MLQRRSQLRAASDAGFTLIEVMVTTMIMLTVSGVVITGVLNMTQLNATTTNRSAMFAGVRNATALLQQEVGQAGRISLPAPVTVNTAAIATATSLEVSSVAGMFVGEYIVVGTGDTGETVAITAINGTTLTVGTAFENKHDVAEPVTVQGAFWAGVVPPHLSDGTDNPDGSTGSVLKIFGDINGSGKMVYVEYTCDLNAGVLYRNQMDFDAAKKEDPGVEQILVENVQQNPDKTDCFTYQEQTIAAKVFVIGVAITLTVQSEDRDPITQEFQKESKALLNVSPRNVFNAWLLYSQLMENRVQPTPDATAKLMPAN